jgi:hypothetical protein
MLGAFYRFFEKNKKTQTEGDFSMCQTTTATPAKPAVLTIEMGRRSCVSNCLATPRTAGERPSG